MLPLILSKYQACYIHPLIPYHAPCRLLASVTLLNSTSQPLLPLSTSQSAVVYLCFESLGPYTLPSNLEFIPLESIIKHLLSPDRHVNVALLIGPFLPYDHPILVKGKSHLLPDQVFATRVAPLLSQLTTAGIKVFPLYLYRFV